MNNIYQTIARYFPRKLRYFILIDSWAKATTGKYSNVEAPSVLMIDVIDLFKD